MLTPWCGETHICVSKLSSIGSDNGLSPGRRQAIIWTNAGILLIRNFGTNCSKMSSKIHINSLKNDNKDVLGKMAYIWSIRLNVLKGTRSRPLVANNDQGCQSRHQAIVHDLTLLLPHYIQCIPAKIYARGWRMLCFAVVMIRIILYIYLCVSSLALGNSISQNVMKSLPHVMWSNSDEYNQIYNRNRLEVVIRLQRPLLLTLCNVTPSLAM